MTTGLRAFRLRKAAKLVLAVVDRVLLGTVIVALPIRLINSADSRRALKLS
jgi:hypothetical protein